MTGILDQYLKQPSGAPAHTIDDVFGIALARRLGDLESVDIYRKIASHYPYPVLADAAKRTVGKAPSKSAVFPEFYRTLTHDRFGGSGTTSEIVSLKIERKAIGVVVASGARVVHTEIRNLRYANEEAARSAGGLVKRLAEDHPDASFAFDLTADEDTRRAQILQAAIDAAREFGLPLWTFQIDELLAAYSAPPCRTREEMRGIVGSLYGQPELSKHPMQLDALAIALVAYCRIVLGSEGAGVGKDKL
jgi:hypothetical protein